MSHNKPNLSLQIKPMQNKEKLPSKPKWGKIKLSSDEQESQ